MSTNLVFMFDIGTYLQYFVTMFSIYQFPVIRRIQYKWKTVFYRIYPVSLELIRYLLLTLMTKRIPIRYSLYYYDILNLYTYALYMNLVIGSLFVRTMGWQNTEEHQKTSVHDSRHSANRISSTSIPHENHQWIHDCSANGRAWRNQWHHRKRSNDFRAGKSSRRTTRTCR